MGMISRPWLSFKSACWRKANKIYKSRVVMRLGMESEGMEFWRSDGARGDGESSLRLDYEINATE